MKEQERKGGVHRPIRPAPGSGTWLHTAATTGIIMQHNAWPCSFDVFYMCLWVRLYFTFLLISLTSEFTELLWPAGIWHHVCRRLFTTRYTFIALALLAILMQLKLLVVWSYVSLNDADVIYFE